MMSFFVRKDSLEQGLCHIILFSFRDADYPPVQLNGPAFLFPVAFQHFSYRLANGDSIRPCCRFSSKSNDSLRNGFSVPHLGNRDLPQSRTREPER